jgi:hypothetical protein
MRRGSRRTTIHVSSPQDLGAGLLFIAIGGAGVYFAQELAFGSARNMGPGYFPTLLSILIIAIGLIVAARGVTVAGPPIEKIRLRPILFLLAAMLLFGFLIKIAGLVITAVLLTILASYAQARVRIGQTIILAFVLAAFVTVVFVLALGQPMPVWWGN